MIPLFDKKAYLSRVQSGARSDATKHQNAANRAFQRLETDEKYRPRYHLWFKKAAKSFTDLEELVEISLTKREPAKYFNKSVNNLLYKK